MIKHYHADPNGNKCEINKVNNKYLLVRLSDDFLSPIAPTRLRDAKLLIDSGEANITYIEYKAKEYLQELKAFPKLAPRWLEWRVWNLGDCSAELALEWFDEIYGL